MELILLTDVVIYQSILLFLEGVGVQFFHNNFVVFSFPAFMCAVYLLLKKPKHDFSPISVIGWILFLSSAIMGTFTVSILKHEALQISFFYLHLCVFFLLGNAYKEEVSIIAQRTFVFLGLLFGGIFFVLLFKKTPSFVNGYQFIYPAFGSSHNHGGELVGPIFYLLLETPLPPAMKGLLGILVLATFLASFSRSAYLAFICVGGFLFLKHKKLLYLLIVAISCIVTVGYVITTIDPLPVPQLKPLQTLLQSRLGLRSRSLLSGRDAYFFQSVQSIVGKPFFGTGPGSFYLASKKEASSLSFQTSHAHNLFLEVGVEQGLIGVLGLALILFVPLTSLFREKKYPKIALIFLFLFLVFQTDYTYAIHGVLVIFFICAGILTPTTERRFFPLVPVVAFLGILQTLWVVLFTSSTLFLLYGNIIAAQAVYPLSIKANHVALISFPYEQAKGYILPYLYASPNASTNLDVGYFYVKNGYGKTALPYFQKAFTINPSLNLQHVAIYIKLVQEYGTKKELVEMKKTFVQTYSKYRLSDIPIQAYKNIIAVCGMIKPSCDKIPWYREVSESK